MTAATVTLKGIVHGKTIQLDQDPGIREGQAVSVVLRPALPPGEGLRRAFGTWSDDPQGLQKFLQETYNAREDDRPEPPTVSYLLDTDTASTYRIIER